MSPGRRWWLAGAIVALLTGAACGGSGGQAGGGPSAAAPIATPSIPGGLSVAPRVGLLAAPEPQPVPAPPEGFTFAFDEGASPALRDMVRAGAAMASGYLTGVLGASLKPLTLSTYTDPERYTRALPFRADCQVKTALYENRMVSYRALKSTGGYNDEGELVLYFAPRNGPLSQWEINYVVVHELFHHAQRAAGGAHPSSVGAPAWLVEGSATLAAMAANGHYGLVDMDGSLASMANAARWTGLSLLEAAVPQPTQEQYVLGALALGLTAQASPDDALRDVLAYFREAGRGASVEAAFLTAFGTPLPVFAAGFESKRIAGFAYLSGVEGRVLNARGLPEPGVSVAACRADDRSRCEFAVPLTDGRFRLGVEPGDWLLQVSALDDAATPLGFFAGPGAALASSLEGAAPFPAGPGAPALVLGLAIQPTNPQQSGEAPARPSCAVSGSPAAATPQAAPTGPRLIQAASAGATRLEFAGVELGPGPVTLLLNPGAANEERVVASGLSYYRDGPRRGYLLLDRPSRFAHAESEAFVQAD